MSRPLPPTITVSCGEWQRTFAPDRGDVVIGRDARADVPIPDQLVSRAHALLRHHHDRWVAIDNDSLNGIYVGHRRMHSVDISDGQTLHLGNPAGPRLTFRLGRAVGPSNSATVARPTPQPQYRPSSPTGRAADQSTEVLGITPEVTHSLQAPLHADDVVAIGNVDLLFANGTLVRRTAAAATTGGLEVRDVSVTLGRTATLLDSVSVSARPGTLTAIIGPSGSGKSTLSGVIAGVTRPSTGTVSFEGHDLAAEYALLRSRIGLVPQDDVVHHQLTIDQALGFAAELRMAPDTTADDRRHAIAQVLAELELAPHAKTRIDKLSGGQRKRVSVAMELLTNPSLLVLDEPTSGLDPALDRQVMTMLRKLADAGRVVVVVTHSLTFLDVCDQVLLLAPGGRVAFCGPPADVGPAMGAGDWADIFTDVCDDPGGAQQRFRDRTERLVANPVPQASEKPVDLGALRRANLLSQVSTIVRRQVGLIAADRTYLLFLVVLPLVVGLLPLAVAGHAGFGKPPPGNSAPFEPKQILALLNFGAVLMGTALTVRQIVGERAIFAREQAAGLSTSAYLLAKVAVFGAIAMVQSAVLVLIVTAPVIGKRAPAAAAVLGSPMVELFVDVAATCVAAAIAGLAVSALARTSNQVLPLTAVTLMAQLVLAGAMIPVTDRLLLDPISWLTPARWGLAATAATADLSNLVAGVPKDSHWVHSGPAWLFDIAMAGVLALGYAGFVRWKIRLRRPGGV